MDNNSKISKFDVKILNEFESLDELNYSKIGKKVKKSKSFVKYRFDRMISKGIIRKIWPIFDVSKLGYHMIDIYLLVRESNENKSEMITYYENDESANYIDRFAGKYNLVISFYVKDFAEMAKKISEMTQKFGNEIYRMKAYIIYKTYHCKHNFLQDFKRIETNSPNYQIGNFAKITESDKTIIKTLEKHSTASILELSRLTGLNPKTIKSKINNLKKEKIIYSLMPGIDSLKLGYMYKVFFLEVKESRYNKIDEMMSHLLSSKHTLYLASMINEPLIVADLVFQTNEEFHRFNEQFRMYFEDAIIDVSYLDKATEIKYTYLPKDL